MISGHMVLVSRVVHRLSFFGYLTLSRCTSSNSPTYRIAGWGGEGGVSQILGYRATGAFVSQFQCRTSRYALLQRKSRQGQKSNK